MGCQQPIRSKTDGLGFKGMNTCHTVKARKYSKVNMRRWLGNRSLYMKKGNEVMVMVFGLIQYGLHVLRWKFMYCVRNLKYKLEASFAISAFLLDQVASLLQAV